uniref:Globin family profile domain-containing protein n=1 Tax=Panagrolaimus sp. JU765 TaxID=591449 RepID=A0AC34PZB0_9BILA
MTWDVFDMLHLRENSMTSVWKNFTNVEKLLLKNSFQKCCQNPNFGCLIIIGLLKDKHDVFKSLLPTKKETVITCPEILRKEYPRAIKIGDAIVNFFREIINGIYDETMTPREVINKCRLIGAKHKRIKVEFNASNWMSVKRVIVETVIKLNEKTSSPAKFLKKITKVDDNFQLRIVWQHFAKIVIKNMKSGFLDSAAHGPEFVENQSVYDITFKTSDSVSSDLSTDVFL